MIRLAPASLLALLVGCTPTPHWSLPLSSLDRAALSVYQASANETWVVGGALGSGGGALALEYDGDAWNRFDVGTDATLWWVTQAGLLHRYAVGERGTVIELLSRATVPTPTTSTLYGVWGSEQGTLWVVGGEPDLSGVILVGNGDGSWTDMTPPGATGAFFKVWGSSDSDVWICGQAGALLHWDGQALTSVDTGLSRSVSLFTVAGRDRQDIYAVGGPAQAIALHYDGTSWSQLGDSVFANLSGLNGVSVDSDGTAVMVGFGGTKLRGRPGAFVDETAFATHDDLHAVSVAGGEVFAVGGDYLSPAPTPRTGVVAHFGGDVSSTIK